jgi:hypothetical protein
MKFRLLLLCCIALLSACATTRSVVYDTPSHPPAPASDRYEAIAGREPAVIDPLRAAAPAAAAEILAGKTPAADQELLTPQGYVLIGNSYHLSDDAAARDWISAQGQQVGADKIRLYPNLVAGQALAAAYFVRLRLVFGASFRDLNSKEKQQFGDGIRLGEIVGESPASRANLRSNDVIRAIDGQPVSGRSAFQALLKQRMGKVVTLSITRNGEALQRKVQLGRSFGSD